MRMKAMIEHEHGSTFVSNVNLEIIIKQEDSVFFFLSSYFKHFTCGKENVQV